VRSVAGDSPYKFREFDQIVSALQKLVNEPGQHPPAYRLPRRRYPSGPDNHNSVSCRTQRTDESVDMDRLPVGGTRAVVIEDLEWVATVSQFMICHENGGVIGSAAPRLCNGEPFDPDSGLIIGLTQRPFTSRHHPIAEHGRSEQ
jgi:hypothetical protein